MTNEELMIETLKGIHQLFAELAQSNDDCIQEYAEYPPMSEYFEGKRDAYTLAAERIEMAITLTKAYTFEEVA